MLPVLRPPPGRMWRRSIPVHSIQNFVGKHFEVDVGSHGVGDQRHMLPPINTFRRHSLDEFVTPHPHCDLPAPDINTIPKYRACQMTLTGGNTVVWFTLR